MKLKLTQYEFAALLQMLEVAISKSSVNITARLATSLMKLIVERMRMQSAVERKVYKLSLKEHEALVLYIFAIGAMDIVTDAFYLNVLRNITSLLHKELSINH